MNNSISLKDYLHSRYKTTVILTILSFIVMLFCNILLFYHEGVVPLLDFVNYETESQIQMLKGNQIDQYYSRYSSILSSKSFSGIYSIYRHFDNKKNTANHEYITPGSVIIEENKYFWIKVKDSKLGFNWNSKSPIDLNIAIKKRIEAESPSEDPAGFYNFFVLKKYNIWLNLFMLIPDLFILIFGIKYHFKLKKNHIDFIEQFNEAEKLFLHEFSFNIKEEKADTIKPKHDVIISEFFSLREIALDNAIKHIEKQKIINEFEIEKIYLNQQKELFNNINKTNHDFARTLELCKIFLSNKLLSKESLYINEVENLYNQISYCSRLVTEFKDLATPLRGRERIQDWEELLKSLDMEHNKKYIKEKNIQIISKLDHELLFKLDDGFERVFNNIISNAIEVMPKNEILYITNTLSDEKIEFKFKNTGTNINFNEIEKIKNNLNFSKSPTFKYRGNGLTIANEILKAHNGGLIINSSQEENWVEICIFLPRTVVVN